MSSVILCMHADWIPIVKAISVIQNIQEDDSEK